MLLTQHDAGSVSDRRAAIAAQLERHHQVLAADYNDADRVTAAVAPSQQQ